MPKVSVDAFEVENESLSEALAEIARRFGAAADAAAQGSVPTVEGVTIEGDADDPNPSGTEAAALVASGEVPVEGESGTSVEV